MITYCQEIIWLNKSASTTCMRERSHKGKHYIYNREPTEAELLKMVEEYNAEPNK